MLLLWLLLLLHHANRAGRLIERTAAQLRTDAANAADAAGAQRSGGAHAQGAGTLGVGTRSGRHRLHRLQRGGRRYGDAARGDFRGRNAPAIVAGDDDVAAERRHRSDVVAVVQMREDRRRLWGRLWCMIVVLVRLSRVVGRMMVMVVDVLNGGGRGRVECCRMGGCEKTIAAA